MPTSRSIVDVVQFLFDSKGKEFILSELQHYEDTGESYGFEETFK